MTGGCASWGTDAVAARAPVTRGRCIALLVLLPAIGATDAPAPTVPAPAAVSFATPSELRDQMDRIEKAERKAEEALDGRDLARASFLMQRADEEIVRFEGASRLTEYVAAIAVARQAAGAASLPAAEAALRRARACLVPLADYTVSRSAEIAYRAALAAAEEGQAPAFLQALARMDEASLAGAAEAAFKASRDALQRGRLLIGRVDAAGAAREVAAAREALARLRYAGALARSRSGLMMASELLRDAAVLAARDQAQRGLRDLEEALQRAPEADRPGLTEAQEAARTVWRRMSRAEQQDPDRLAAASQRVEEIRLKQRP
jgi:hypothetical protein